jgi:hypothetical protein
MSLDRDTEMAFIRALSTLGTQLGGSMPAADRQERIRVAILTQRLAGRDFVAGPDGSMETFRAAYERCYDRSLDLRRTIRDAHGRVVIQPLARPGDDDEEGDDDEPW